MSDTEALLHRLFDDASLFPPARLPLAEALAGHRRHRAAGYGEAVGPLVVGPTHLPLMPQDIEVALTGDVAAVADALAQSPAARVVSVETSGALPVVLDLLRRHPGYAEIDLRLPAAEVQRGIRDCLDAGVAVKFRTGGTTADAFPTQAELAVAVLACATLALPFKLTAGLHDPARHRDPVTGFEHHGLLNVVLAVDLAQQGATVAEVAGVLGDQDQQALADGVRALPSQRVAAVRACFRSVGTCSIEECLAGLSAVGLRLREHAA